MIARRFVGLLVTFIVFGCAPARGQIESVVRCTAHPMRYARVDFLIMLRAQWTNPYCASEVALNLDLVSPGGNRITVPAYYEKGRSGQLSTWKVRFAPTESGSYSGAFLLTNAGGQNTSSNISFAVSASSLKGFLRIANAWTFRFDNGEPFRGIGENVGWESRSSDDSQFFRGLQESPRYNYEYLLGRLSANGGNFFRTWMCPWNLPLEWKKVGNRNRYADDDGYFNASAMRRMDQLVDLAESLDVYMMLTLNNSGDFQGHSWQRNSYNRLNGGPVDTPPEFFTDSRAKAQFKNRLRYLVARWGYSPHIAAWELFNEIDNLMYGLQPPLPDNVIAAWHREMSEYLKGVDPYHHLVTTSISHRDVAGLDSIASMDFNQKHIYGHNGKSQLMTIPETLRRYSRLEQKPFVIGEFGYEWDWNKNFDDFADNMDGDFRKGLWLGLFSPTPILPMSWWWEYFDHRNTTEYFARVRRVLNQMLTAGGGSFISVQCKWSGQYSQTLAVQCGKTFFVLLINDGREADSGAVTLPLDLSNKCRARVYDPARDKSEPLPAAVPSHGTAGGITVPAGSVRILTVLPANS